jgi:hypothetical protein
MERWLGGDVGMESHSKNNFNKLNFLLCQVSSVSMRTLNLLIWYIQEHFVPDTEMERQLVMEIVGGPSSSVIGTARASGFYMEWSVPE